MIDPADYFVADTSGIYSPGLVLFRELLEHNLAETIRLCGGPHRWRPHIKTHKTREIVQRQMDLGVRQHKCATVAEAELLASVGVPDVLIAYPMVGPNLQRLSRLIDTFPETEFAVLADNPDLALQMGEVLCRHGQEVGVMVDLNTGMNRTGIDLNSMASELYELVSSMPGLRPAGLHWYDGHHRQVELDERREGVLAGWQQFIRFRDQLLMSGFEVPRIVASGSGSFAILAATEEPGLELSPGTTTLYDADCVERFAELPLKPAVAIITRVISHSGRGQITLDVGHKACAADPPAGRRLFFPSLPDAKEIQQSEEHLVIETSQAYRLKVGDDLWAISRHICPTMALHEYVTVVSQGQIVDRWNIAARNRCLTI